LSVWVVLGLLTGAVVVARPLYVLDLATALVRADSRLHPSHVNAGDHRWAFDEGGRGAPVLLLHGFAGTRSDWYATIAKLPYRFHLIVPDLPGWGESERLPDADYGVEAQVERLADFFRARRLSAVHLVGHSMGGHIAGLFAARYPQWVKSLTLVANTGVRFQENEFARSILEGATPFNISNRADWDRLMDQAFVSKPWLPHRTVDALIAQNMAEHDFLAASLRRLRSADQAFLLEGELARLRVPVHVLWCRQDKMLDVSSVDSMRAKLPRARYSIIEQGCGHMPMIELPRNVATLLVSHIAVASSPVAAMIAGPDRR
jgi:pimeloyl-ACP methyl ester carboxylesterase